MAMTRRMALGLALVIASACDRPIAPVPVPPAPPPAKRHPGQLAVGWASDSRSYAAAVILEIHGGPIGAVSNPDARLFLHVEHSADSSSARVVVAGEIFSQDLAVFEVPDVQALASYTTTIVAAVGPEGENYDLAGYRLRIYERAP
jgi:hypothetical protein